MVSTTAAAHETEREIMIQVENLVRRYGELTAVGGVSFHVYRQEIFGLLGPNGAGKTTTLEMIEGMRRATSGSIQVAGIDVVRQPRLVRRRIGIQLQEAGYLPNTTVNETLTLFAALQDGALDVEALLELVGLSEQAGQEVTTLSGGQKQRLSIGLALLNDPTVLFLDEPTTGLDPQARQHLWVMIRNLRAEGRTIVLTTHYMKEAELLCDRVGIMDHGQLVALDTPQRLIRQHANHFRIRFDSDAESLDGLRSLPAVTDLERSGTEWTLETWSPDQTLPALFRLMEGRSPRGLTLESGTLEDVFLNLTGRSLRD